MNVFAKFQVIYNISQQKVDGEWSAWTKYGKCTKTCGSGTQRRTRKCDSPAPKHGGQTCVGGTTDSRQCNTNPCPGTTDIAAI